MCAFYLTIPALRLADNVNMKSVKQIHSQQSENARGLSVSATEESVAEVND